MTLSTLRFGGTARTIQNTVEANIKSNKNSELLKTYQKDLDSLRKELEDAQAGGKEFQENNLNIQKQLEDKITRLNTLLVQEQPKISESPKEKLKNISEVFKSPSGYLTIDSRLKEELVFSSGKEFEDKGAVIFEKMKSLAAEVRAKNREIEDLNEAKSFLQDSKVNVREK
jgi:cytochrome c556